MARVCVYSRHRQRSPRQHALLPLCAPPRSPTSPTDNPHQPRRGLARIGTWRGGRIVTKNPLESQARRCMLAGSAGGGRVAEGDYVAGAKRRRFRMRRRNGQGEVWPPGEEERTDGVSPHENRRALLLIQAKASLGIGTHLRFAGIPLALACVAMQSGVEPVGLGKPPSQFTVSGRTGASQEMRFQCECSSSRSLWSF